MLKSRAMASGANSTDTGRRRFFSAHDFAHYFIHRFCTHSDKGKQNGMAAQLTLYTRQGCHLCEDMAQTLDELSVEMRFSVQAIDISDNAMLEQAYGSRVPVLMLADKLICEYFLDPHALQQALSEHTDD